MIPSEYKNTSLQVHKHAGWCEMEMCGHFHVPSALSIGKSFCYSFIRSPVGLRSVIKTRGLGPLANYADRATAACWRSSANFRGERVLRGQRNSSPRS
jgi:hypothetical protein